MARPRLATVWLGGCSGCHMSFLDLDEFLVELGQKAELVFSPVLVDAKEYPENVDFVLVEGAVSNDEQLALARKLRERTKIVISFGDCAVTGNLTALRNPLGPDNAEKVLQRSYIELADIHPQIPRASGLLPQLLERVRPLHEVVRVDYFLPGCPPPAVRIKTLLSQLLAGQAPQLVGKQIKFG